MADFQTIAAVILEKDGIIAMPFVVSGAFDISGPRPDDNLSQPVNLAGTIRPEGDPTLICNMPRRLGHAKKLRSTVQSGSFELQPALDLDITCEPQCRQYCFVEGARLSQALHPQVNVVVSPPHQESLPAVES